MKIHPMIEWCEELDRRRDSVAWYDGLMLDEPERLKDNTPVRSVTTIEPPPTRTTYVSIEEVETKMMQSIRAYTAKPDGILVLKTPPGVGKTRLAVQFAEELAMRGLRIGFFSARRDMFETLLKMASHPDLWYQWQPRHSGDAEHQQTCNHTDRIKAWMEHGHKGRDFCTQVCGWEYMQSRGRFERAGCIYHAQRHRPERIIVGQHENLFLGHALMDQLSLLIVDESPLDKFTYDMVVDARHILPPDMDRTDPLTHLLYDLQGLAEQGKSLENRALLDALGGACHVSKALEDRTIQEGVLVTRPPIRDPDDVERVPYAHVPQLIKLLQDEAEMALSGIDYNHHVTIENGKLVLQLRRDIYEHVPKSIIVLDATANKHLYERVWRRKIMLEEAHVKPKGRIFQVTSRANGAAALMWGDSEHTREQLRRQIEYITQKYGYKKVGVITFKQIEHDFPADVTGHFGGVRGSNDFVGCDALIVIGTYQPPPSAILRKARGLYYDRKEAFNGKARHEGGAWGVQLRPYEYCGADGKGRAYPVTSYWGDADLEALMWQVRDAEMIQVVHRSRINRRSDVDVWLFSNLPLEGVPPTELLDTQALLDAPSGVNIYRWNEFGQFVEQTYETQGYVLSTDVRDGIQVERETATKWMKKLLESGEWRRASGPARGRGKPPLCIVRV
jgi:hypothetical protein